MKPLLLAITSDHHTNSTIGLCPPEGVKLDDGGRYLPGKVQRWMWECWEDYWRKIKTLQHETKAELWCLFNGDLVDGGPHHGTTQIVSANLEIQSYIADRTFGVPLALNPSHTFVVRGTEAHVGPSASSEEALARHLKAERDGDRWSFWHLRLEERGTRLDCQHHGRSGFRPWTEQNALALLANQIFLEHARKGIPHPQLAIRSHFHKYGDSHDASPTRVIQTPAWQVKTAYAHKVVPESIADIGGVSILLQEGNPPTVQAHLYPVDLPPIWKAA